MPEPQLRPREVKIRIHDGIDIAVALYMPEGEGRFPVVLGASPYRYDNNALPASPQFLWRETGPIGLYVERGYVYAQMDVRGCGKSGGEFRFLDRNEQKDLYDVKIDLHTRGNIEGFRRARGPKKLKMIGPVNAFVANREFNSRELHEALLLPFYDHYLKGLKTDYVDRPAVEYFVRGADAVRASETWPPPGVRYVSWHLS